MQSVVSTCIYCANACKLEYIIENGRITHVLPCREDAVSRGKPCIKGLTINEVVYKGRIVKPMIRSNGKLKETSWEVALAKIYKKLKQLDPSEIFIGASGKVTNEDNWVIQKFTRSVLSTNNVDGCCARLCHAPTVIAFSDCLGIEASPAYLDDIPKLDCLLIIGSNPASNHPIVFHRILELKKKGGKIITVAPIYSETAEYADVHLSIEPGTEIAFLNCMSNYLVKTKRYEKIAEKFDGFKEFAEKVSEFTFEFTAKVCQADPAKLEKVAELIASAQSFGVMHGMGLTQHVNSTAAVRSLVDLALLKNGKIVTNRGEINVQGCGDMLCSPSVLSEDKVHLKKLKEEWKCDLPISIGMNLIQAIGLAQAKAALISGFNPAHSMPDLKRIHKNLKRIFLVQMDSYFNLTSGFADVILPTPLLIERTGSITSGERRVRLVSKVAKPFGESKPEWQIYCWLARIFDSKLCYAREEEITQEIVRLVKAYNRIDVKALYRGLDQFASKEIKFRRFIFEGFKGIEETRSKKYPFLLFTFRSSYHFLTNEATGKAALLNKAPLGPYFYLNPEDAKELDIKDLDEIAVSSRIASLKGYAKLNKRIPRGFIGAHFHFENLLVNKLIPLEFDKESFTPNFKAVAVRVKNLSEKTAYF